MNFQPVWTAERVAALRQLISDGYSSSQAGAKLGVTRNAVIGKRHRLGDALTRKSPWSPERVALFKHKLADDTPMDQITAEPGVSRDAGYRKAHRLGIKRTRKPRQRKPKETRVTALHAAFELAATEATDLQAEPNRNGVLFFDAQPHHCRWPLNDSREVFQFLFCGADKLEPFPYCGFHSRLAYQLPVERQRREA